MNVQELHEQLPQRLRVESVAQLASAKSHMLNVVNNTNYVITLAVLRDIIVDDIASATEFGDNLDTRERLVQLLSQGIEHLINEI